MQTALYGFSNVVVVCIVLQTASLALPLPSFHLPSLPSSSFSVPGGAGGYPQQPPQQSYPGGYPAPGGGAGYPAQGPPAGGYPPPGGAGGYPQGGAGYPQQAPPQGGVGYPQQAPPQGGVGYPQQGPPAGAGGKR